MKLSQLKQHLDNVSDLKFVQPNGSEVPRHFHITEAGLSSKHFIDCGGTTRTEKKVSFQMYVAKDYDHRLEPKKLQKIIGLSENLFGNEDLEVEVEYQMETIGRFGLEMDGENFLLTAKKTDCLAKDNCGISESRQTPQSVELVVSNCKPGGGCC